MHLQFLEPEPSAHQALVSGPETRTENENPAEQELAAEESQSDAVTALLTTTQRKIRRRRRRFWGSFAAFEGTIALLVCLAELNRHSDRSGLPPVLILLAVAATASVVWLYTMLKPGEFDAEELRRIGGVRAIGPLIDSLSSGKLPSSRADTYRALTVLLPQLQATDANLLTASRRRALNNLLKMEAWPGWWGPKPIDPSFSLAVLKAYEQVGDVKAVPVVEKLTNLKPRAPRQRAIQQAAAECLPLLHSHAMPLDQNQTLLRAAGQSNAAADILLRPAADTDTTPANELLRASVEGAETNLH